MLKQYSIINSCLAELKGAGLSADDKLRLEVLLIQIKRILLHGSVEQRIDGNRESEQEFSDLLSHFRHLSCEHGNNAGADQLISLVAAFKCKMTRTLETGPDLVLNDYQGEAKFKKAIRAVLNAANIFDLPRY